MSDGRYTAEDLVRSLAELRALARRIEPDPHRAEDLLQDLCIAVLERPPTHERSALPWFRVVLQRLRALRYRAETRRAARETTLVSLLRAREGESSERDDLLREVTQAVMQLHEPYRSTLTRRYLLGLRIDEIAQQDHVALRTVGTRITRALALVRERLLQRRRSPVRWLLLFARRARDRLAGSNAARGAVAGIAACAVVATVFVLRDRDRTTSGPTPHEATGGTAHATIELPPSGAEANAATEPTRVPVAAVTAFDYRGFVVDSSGTRVAGALVAFEPGRIRADPGRAAMFRADAGAASTTTIAGADGSFHFTLPLDSVGRIVASTPLLSPRLAERVPEGGPRTLELVLAPTRRVTGVARDANGGAVVGAVVRVAPGPSLLTSEQRLEGTWNPIVLETLTDASGAFAIDGACVADDDVISIAHPQFAVASRTLAASERHVEFVLDPPPVDRRVLAGTVVDGSGLPIAGATVAAALVATRTDERGCFALVLPASAHVEDVVAVANGLCSVRVIPGDDAPLVLTLKDRAARLCGRVVGADGKPLPTAVVVLVDPTPLAKDDAAAWFVEHVQLDIGAAPAVQTLGDTEGRFTFAALEPRRYTLHAYDGTSMQGGAPVTVDLATEDAAPDVVLRVDDTALAPELVGRAIDRDGDAIAGLDVRIIRVVCNVPFPDGSAARAMYALPGTTTAADGSFRLARVPLDASVTIEVHGEGFFPRTLDPANLRSQPDVELSRRICVRLALQERWRDATAFDVVDQAGRRLRLEFPTQCTCPSMHARRATEGCLREARTDPFFTSDRAAFVVLRRGTEELTRIAINAIRDGITIVEG